MVERRRGKWHGRAHRRMKTDQETTRTQQDEMDCLTTKGDLLNHDGNSYVRLAVGIDGALPYADSTQSGGIKWSSPNYIETTLNTKGDLLSWTSDYARLAVGSNGHILTADSGESTGLKWEARRESKSITVEDPSDSEDLSFFFTNRAITITEIRAVLVGSDTPSVTWTLRHGTDRSAAGAEVVTGGTTTTSVSTGSDVTSFDDATIVADSFVWLETTAQSGTVGELHLTVFYTED